MSNLRNNVAQLISLLVLAGCGGDSFTSFGSNEATGDGSPTVLDAGTGGASTIDVDVDSGNAAGGAEADAGSGGAPGTGGERSAGGAIGTGGSLGSTGGAGGEGTGGAPETGGVKGTGGSGTGGVVVCTPVTHDNGTSQTWQDCVPLDTYNEAQAMKACAASGATSCLSYAVCNGMYSAVRGTSGGQALGVWGYSGLIAGYVAPYASGAICSGSTGNQPWG